MLKHPAQFIRVAEDSGLILPIADWVLREACKQVRAWLDAGLPLATIAVNASAKEFRDDDFLEGLFAILTKTALDPRCLGLELTITTPDEATIATAVISMSRSLKHRVIAEGVETAEAMAFLQAHQCDEAHGYYFSRPTPPRQFASYLKRHSRTVFP